MPPQSSLYLSCCNRLPIEILLETGEGFVDLFGTSAKVGHGVRQGVVVLEQEERGEFFLVEFFHADGDVVLEDEIEEDLLLGAESGVDVNTGVCRQR